MKLRTQEEFDAHVKALPETLACLSEDIVTLHSLAKTRVDGFSKERDKLISRMDRECQRLEARTKKLETRLRKFDASRPHVEDWNPHPVSPLRARTQQVLQDLQAHIAGLREQIAALRAVSSRVYRPTYSPNIAENTKAMTVNFRELMGCENV